MKDGKVEVGDVVRDWTRGDRVVEGVIRPEQLGRYTDNVWHRRGSTSERCALHGGNTRPQRFQVQD